MRALDRLYLTVGGELVNGDNHTGATLYCKPGDEISAADIVTYRATFEALGWIQLTKLEPGFVNVVSLKIRHDDATDTRQFSLPARSIILDIFVRCTENAAGDPDIDFGEYGGDRDGLLDGIGQDGVCDLTTSEVDTTGDFKGRGEMLTSVNNEHNARTKILKYFSSNALLTNTCNSAGTAGEWVVTIMYITLPEIS